ncbi:MAG: adenosine kinase [Actinomycetota bacterium]|nr:adenosine kinase [Actinomycetota bacterium]
MVTKKYKVLGIGNAIMDVVANVEDNFLKKHNLRKGSMKIIDESEVEKLHSCIRTVKEVSGGSVANTIATLSLLGDRAAFIGKVGNDDLGKSFKKDLKNLGVRYCVVNAGGDMRTACCIVLTTPDAQRTMNTYLGVSGFLKPEDINEISISQSEILYLEGYLFDSGDAKEAFKKAINIAVKAGSRVALTLSDSFCVKRHRKEFLSIAKGYIDVLFANEEEILSLFGVKNIEDAVRECSKVGNISVITRSEKGSVIVSEGKVNNVAARKNDNVVDTTGAGDLYAAGFLHGLAGGMNLETCGKMGSAVASKVLSQFGARLESSVIELVNKEGF